MKILVYDWKHVGLVGLKRKSWVSQGINSLNRKTLMSANGHHIYRKRKMVDRSMKKSQRNAKNRRSRFVRKCPVEIGDEYEVDVTETTPNGVGIARVKGFLILIADTKPGDHIKVIITKTDPLNAEAELVT